MEQVCFISIKTGAGTSSGSGNCNDNGVHRNYREREMGFELLLLTTVLLCFATNYNAVSAASNTSTCPMDMGYVERVPWDSSSCSSFPRNNTNCCQTLLSLFGIALAVRLKETSLFQLPDIPTSSSCISDFQSKLDSLSLPSDLASVCFSPSQFVASHQLCAGINTKQDWLNKLGPSTALNTACQSDLSIGIACDACIAAEFKVQARLISIDGNKTHSVDCFYSTLLYVAAFVHEYGPESTRAACIFGLPLAISTDSKKHLALVFALTGVGTATFLMSCFLGLYLWFKRWRRNVANLEETSPKHRLRPNTVSIWFKIGELEKATDNFSQKNLIGHGGFGVVYKGTLSDETPVAVKKIIESNFQGDAEFCNEVEIISNLKHQNLVPLRGCCVANETDEERGKQRYLVYEFMLNWNLDDHLFYPFNDHSNSSRQSLSWPQRKSIILDCGQGACLPALWREACNISQRHQGHQHTVGCRYESKGGRLWAGQAEQRRGVSSHHQSCWNTWLSGS
uniref:non-specific serine/threonine protein kinase n=1 Tax=Nelumbo nucifera TaxID=4432 RepID=A0A822ZAA0_NELNU|nr:TPA_asm: hypothetical protein HUJ06_014688 [Nelumbo nucifera]